MATSDEGMRDVAHERYRRAVREVRRVEIDLGRVLAGLADAELALARDGVAATVLLSEPMAAARKAWEEAREPDPLRLPRFIRQARGS